MIDEGSETLSVDRRIRKKMVKQLEILKTFLYSKDWAIITRLINFIQPHDCVVITIAGWRSVADARGINRVLTLSASRVEAIDTNCDG